MTSRSRQKWKSISVAPGWRTSRTGRQLTLTPLARRVSASARALARAASIAAEPGLASTSAHADIINALFGQGLSGWDSYGDVAVVANVSVLSSRSHGSDVSKPIK